MEGRDEVQRWILIGNCQVHGLAQCLAALSRGLVVEAIDEPTYIRDADKLHATLDGFDRILAMDVMLPKLPAVTGPRVFRLPAVLFSGYHPDFCYLSRVGPLSRGLLGQYHSVTAYSAFVLGMDVHATIALFERGMYEAMGGIAHWEEAKAALVRNFAASGLDVKPHFVRWSRRGVFMHTMNHPRIDVLMDVARLLLRQAGLEVVDPGLFPMDNLLSGPVLPVYPDVGARLGVQGNYWFKLGGNYRMIGLEEFVESSFETYRSAGSASPDLPDSLRILSSMVGYLSGWDTKGARACPNGSKPTYRGLFALELMRKGDFSACFIFGMHGSAGSFLHDLVQRLCLAANVPALNIPDRMFTRGLRDEWPENPEVLGLLEEGVLQYGFRELPPVLMAPAARLDKRKSVLLVQDPRDALVSRHMLTGGRRLPPHRDDPDTDPAIIAGACIEDMDEYVLADAEALRLRMRDYIEAPLAKNVLVRRYENIWRDKEGFANEIFEHLGITIPRQVLQSVSRAESPAGRDDLYTPGIHRRKLRPDTITTLNHLFRDVAAKYGYAFDDEEHPYG